MSKQVDISELDVEELQAETQKLVQSNQDKQKALMQATGGTLDEGFLAAIKLEVFIDSFLDEKAKAVFAHNLQIRLKTLLDEDMKRLRQAQLLEGINNRSSNIVLPEKFNRR